MAQECVGAPTGVPSVHYYAFVTLHLQAGAYCNVSLKEQADLIAIAVPAGPVGRDADIIASVLCTLASRLTMEGGGDQVAVEGDVEGPWAKAPKSVTEIYKETRQHFASEDGVTPL